MNKQGKIHLKVDFDIIQPQPERVKSINKIFYHYCKKDNSNMLHTISLQLFNRQDICRACDIRCDIKTLNDVMKSTSLLNVINIKIHIFYQCSFFSMLE
jgi:hypothetical protein